jgi:hypothetical protein
MGTMLLQKKGKCFARWKLDDKSYFACSIADDPAEIVGLLMTI